MKKQTTHAFNKDIYLLGADSDGQKYWLEAPSWDCNWYWGFGYVETYTNNRTPGLSKDILSHSHIDSSFMGKHGSEYIHNIFDHPTLSEKTFTEKEGWELSELFNQFYFLQKAAENFGRGKCHTADTTIEPWTDKDLAKKINEEIIPNVTDRILEILSPINSK